MIDGHKVLLQHAPLQLSKILFRLDRGRILHIGDSCSADAVAWSSMYLHHSQRLLGHFRMVRLDHVNIGAVP